MCSYNRINGTYASEHRQPVDRHPARRMGIRRRRRLRLGGGPQSTCAPSPCRSSTSRCPDQGRAACKRSSMPFAAGPLDAADVDQAVLRILRLVGQATETVKGGTFDAAAHHALARRIAADGTVLLKNEGDPAPVAGGSHRRHRAGRAARLASRGEGLAETHAHQRRRPGPGDRARRPPEPPSRTPKGTTSPAPTGRISSPTPSNKPRQADVAVLFLSPCRRRRSSRAAIAPTWT